MALTNAAFLFCLMIQLFLGGEDGLALRRWYRRRHSGRQSDKDCCFGAEEGEIFLSQTKKSVEPCVLISIMNI